LQLFIMWREHFLPFGWMIERALYCTTPLSGSCNLIHWQAQHKQF